MIQKKNSFIPLNDLLKKQLEHIAQGKIKNTASLEKQWRGIVGDLVAQNAEVLYVKNKILHVAVKSSSWMSELGFMREQLLREIAEKLPDVEVVDIRFKIAGN